MSGRISQSSRLEHGAAAGLRNTASGTLTHPKPLLVQIERKYGFERGALVGGSMGRDIEPKAREAILEFMKEARELRFSWNEIGEALGIRGQVARSRATAWELI